MSTHDSASRSPVRKMVTVRLTLDGAAQAIPAVLFEVFEDGFGILVTCAVCSGAQAHVRTVAGEALVHIGEVTPLPDGTWLVGCKVIGLLRARRSADATG